ncbi:unnamed protein product [marine sediment metagenome]|uniref:Uncharacterized protein n=1 Tax=marine sediment metagenome TaxID=412755 RepID=X0ZHZ0_9ZZZZ
MEQIQYHIRCKKDEVNKAVLLPGDIERADYIGTKFFRDSCRYVVTNSSDFNRLNNGYIVPSEIDILLEISLTNSYP